MAENRKDNEAGLYYLSKAQLLLVTVGFAVTCVLVFLLGIVIGQGIEERKLLKQEEPLVKVPIQPPSPSAKSSQDAPAKDDQLTFYDTLGKGGGASAKQSPQVEKAVKIKPASDTQPAAEVKEAKTVPAEAPPPVKEIKTAKAAPADAAPVQKEVKEKPEPEKLQTAAKTNEDASRDWTVQVNAFPEERSAQRLADRLKQKGYDAYVTTANFNGRDWYRVRVGHYPTRAQAKQFLEQIQTKENFTKAIAVSK